VQPFPNLNAPLAHFEGRKRLFDPCPEILADHRHSILNSCMNG
jgi:hypothetical protein